MESIFGNKIDSMKGKLRNPNALRESFIYEAMTSKGHEYVKKFVNSPEAKVMLEEDMISDGLLERLKDSEFRDKNLELTVLHIAKEEDDPLLGNLLALRAQERDLMNDLIHKYQEAANIQCNKYTQKFLVDEMPEVFRG